MDIASSGTPSAIWSYTTRELSGNWCGSAEQTPTNIGARVDVDIQPTSPQNWDISISLDTATGAFQLGYYNGTTEAFNSPIAAGSLNCIRLLASNSNYVRISNTSGVAETYAALWHRVS